MTVRERTEAWEERALRPEAAKSANSRGRKHPMAPCDLRTDFQRDRDRILHSKAFRRLKHKTQVFVAPEGDHYRTRLTHTLEVSQIARTIARALQLNEDLTEAIAMGHDLGHTPFGHAGERTLNQLSSRGFRHHEQSLRVVDVLEGDGGLNLTFEVRDGIVNHTSKGHPATLEGKVVSLADRIAYINHDIDDALRAGLLRPEDLPKDLLDILGDTHGRRIDRMIRDVVEESETKDDILMSDRIGDAMENLRSFMFEKVYRHPGALKEEERVRFMLSHLFEYYMAHPPEGPGDLEQRVVDYIAGMSDRYAIAVFEDISIPRTQH